MEPEGKMHEVTEAPAPDRDGVPGPPRDAPSDEEVVAEILAGRTQRFEVLMRRHNQRLFRTARSVVRSDADAMDVLQEAYTNGFAHLASFERRSRWVTWMTRIVLHEAYARLRREKRTSPMDPVLIDERPEETARPMPGPEGAAESHRLGAVVEAAVDRLPEAFRTVFMLRAVEQLSVAETAACIDIPEETVKTRLFRARALLRADLEARIDDGLPAVHRFAAERCDRVVAAVLARIGAREPQ